MVAGELDKAKGLYATARIPYERIEPVAETFGSLDPEIDARENDVPANEFEGFHRIEKALWEEEGLKGMAPVAEDLLADVEELAEKVETVELEPEQIANGANELLAEVSASKITGEEERYSHVDLVDFEANVEGSEAAFEAVKPLLGPKRSGSGWRNRSRLQDGLQLARALSDRGWVRVVHGADEGGYAEAGFGN